MTNQNNNFRFFVDDVKIEKGKDKDGKDVMKIGGIASTVDKDSDGEEIDPTGFDVEYFTSHGFFNYNHQAKNDPNAIIGEPTSARATKDGLYVEGILYPDSKLAKSVYETAKMLEKSSGNRRMGFSIEGKALERDSFNPKKITKARLTGCALTLNPKNPNTLVNIIKGEYHDDAFVYDYEDLKEVKGNDIVKAEESGCIVHLERDGKVLKIDKDFNIHISEKSVNDIQKDMTTASGAATIAEDVDGGSNMIKTSKKDKKEKFLTKGEVYSEIFNYIYNDIEKADAFYNLIVNTALKSKTMSLEKITKEDIQKLVDIVKGIDTNELEKGKVEKSDATALDIKDTKKDKEGNEEQEEANGLNEDEVEVKKAKMEKAYGEDKKFQELKKAMDEANEKVKEYKEKVEKGEVAGYPTYKEETMIEDKDALTVGNKGAVGNEVMKSEEINSDLVKSFEDMLMKSNTETNDLIKSLAANTETLLENNKDLAKQNDELKKGLEDAMNRIHAIESSPIPSRTVTSTTYKPHRLEKGIDSTNELHTVRDRHEIMTLLEKKAGMDTSMPNMQYAKAMMDLEQNMPLQKSIIEDLKKSEGVDIIG